MRKQFTWHFAAAACMALIAVESSAFDKRVDQIPNGLVYGCANCHIDPNGGGPRTQFGQEIEFHFLTAPGFAGDVMWGSALASLDSDGDGIPNGLELQDPNGTWSTSVPDPGNSAIVSNPGDATSTPPVAVERVAWSSIKALFARE